MTSNKIIQSWLEWSWN